MYQSERKPSRPNSPTGDDTGLRQLMHAARLAAFLGDGSTKGNEAAQAAGADLNELIAGAAAVYRRSIHEDTRAAYVRRWRLFEAWCKARGLLALPSEPETLMIYLSEAVSTADRPAALATLRGWVAAINRVHLEAGQPAPGEDPAMSMFLKGLSKTSAGRRTAPVISALRIAELRTVCRMLDAIDPDRAEVRDRAILGLRREGLGDGEIARLRWSELTFADETLVLRIIDPRTGGYRRGVEVSKPADGIFWSGEAVATWRRTSGETTDYVFCFVDGPGRHVVQGPLSPRTVFHVRHARLRSFSRIGDEPAETLDRAIHLLGLRPLDVVRDKAMLLLGFAGAFRRVDVTGLRWSDIKQADGGLVVHLRRSKTDPMGRGTDVGIPYGRSELTCPVTALAAWRARCEAHLGPETLPDLPYFVRVGRSARMDTDPLTPEALTRMVRRRAQQAGIAGHWGGRSLRAGFISTAADLEIPLERIAKQSRHATLDNLVLYIRNEDPFRRNPAAQVGL